MSKPSAELAGEELAARVAIEVMGWENVHRNTWSSVLPLGALIGHLPGSGGTRVLARYDLHISDAFQVVECLKAQGYDVEITVRATQTEIPDLLPYSVEVFAYNQGAARLRRDYESSGLNLPEVICRAALAAVRAAKDTP